jgi:hypothetical protein
MMEISLDTSFDFCCGPGVSCFTACCRDLNQSLTPYDVLRLKRFFAMDSADFLEHYTAVHTGPRTGLPVVTLRPGDPAELTCPFVTPEGCAVYPDRPSSCRIYPLVRVLSRSRATGELAARYMLLKEPHCKGFAGGHSQSVGQWLESQRVFPYNEMNDSLMEVIAVRNQLLEGPLSPYLAELFYTGCYDLDRFRRRLREGWPEPEGVSPPEKPGIMQEAADAEQPDPETATDEELLRYSLFLVASRIRSAAERTG